MLRIAHLVFGYLMLCVLPSALQPHAQGWPRGGGTEEDRIQASPLLADLDQDGTLEIVVPSLDNYLYVYAHDGSTYPGSWPVNTQFAKGTMSSPAVGNVYGDGALEIVLAGDDAARKNATIDIYSISGTLLESVDLEYNGSASARATPCLIDCYRYDGSQNRHETEEIILRDGDGQMHFVRWDGTGTDFVDMFQNVSAYRTTSQNIERDRAGSQAITPSVSARPTTVTNQTLVAVGSTDEMVYRWLINSDATDDWDLQPLTPLDLNLDTNLRFYSSLALEDVGGSMAPDLLMGGSDGIFYAFKRLDRCAAAVRKLGLGGGAPVLHLFTCDWRPRRRRGAGRGRRLRRWGGIRLEADGTLRDGWPRLTSGDVFASPVIAELDGEPGLEVVAASFDGWIYVWHADGTALDYWPKRLNTPVFGAPAVGDLHGSGRNSIVIAGFDGRLFVFDMPRKYRTTQNDWPQFRGGARRQGVME